MGKGLNTGIGIPLPTLKSQPVGQETGLTNRDVMVNGVLDFRDILRQQGQLN